MNKYKERATLDKIGFFSTFIARSAQGKIRPSIRFYRFLSMILVHLFFVLSFLVDVQILEGDITASRFLGFHLADPFVTLQIILARYELPVNLIIGTITIALFYGVFVGRAFCSWVCPYNFFGEIAEYLNAKLVEKKIIKKREFSPHSRWIFLLSFILATLISGQLVFELFNMVGIVSRFIIYGYSAAIWWAFLIFLGEVFFARRFWCRNICAIGATYSLLCKKSVLKVSWDASKCNHCGVCSSVCLVPHILELTKLKKQNLNLDEKDSKITLVGGDCTLCGRCIDVCHSDALKIENKLKKLI